MKKHLWLKALPTLLALLLVLGIAACSPSDSSGSENDGGTAGNPCQYDHAAREERVIQEATCRQKGIYEIWCRACGEVVERREEEQLEHAWGEPEEVSAATCQSAQIFKYTCTWELPDGSTCGVTREEIGEAALQHNYQYDEDYQYEFCTMCHHPFLNEGGEYENGLLFYSRSDNTLVLEACFDKDATVITVPETVNGKRVVELGSNVFESCPNLQQLNLPQTILDLDDPAVELLMSLGVTEYENGYYYPAGNNPHHFFLGMIDKSVTGAFTLHEDVVSILGNGFSYSDISSVDFPDSVAHFGWNTFRGCQSITSVELPDGITQISSYMFANSAITTLQLPTSVTHVYSNAFEYSALEHIDLSGVTYIGENAFRGAGALESVILGNGLDTISYNVFQGCQSLTVIIPDSVKTFCDNCFSSTKAVVVTASQLQGNERYLMGVKNLTVRGHGTVQSGTFNGWEQLVSLTFDGVSRVMPYAIVDCPNLKSVTFGDGIASVEAFTVLNCASLDTITFSADVREVAAELFMHQIPNGTSTIYNENSFTVTTENGCTYYSNGDNLYFALAGASGATGGVVLPEGVTLIMDGVFSGAENVSSLTLPDTLRFICADGSWPTRIANPISGAYYVGSASNPYMVLVQVGSGSGTYTVSDGVRFILPYAFNGTSVNTVVMGNGVLQVKKYALGNASAVTLPDRLASLGNFPPADIVGDEIGTVNHIPEGLLYLQTGANLKLPQNKLFINDGTYFIGKNAFAQDTVFTEYENAYYIGTKTNPYYALISADADITVLKIHEDTVLIAQYALTNCDSLVSVTVPDSVQFINTCAFYGMSALEVVRMGTGVIEIGNAAFGSCGRLEQVYLGENVRVIRGSAFAGCGNLESIFIPDSVIVCESFITDCTTIHCGMREQPKYFHSYWCKSTTSTTPVVRWNSTQPY